MLQNRVINNSRSMIRRSEAEALDQEKAKITGLEARAKRRRRGKVGLETERLLRDLNVVV